MSQTTSVPPAFQSIKSLPPEFKFDNNRNSGIVEKHGKVKLRSTDLIESNGRENGATVGKVSKEADSRAGGMDLFDEESPYGGNGESFEDRPLYANEDSISASLPQPSISTSSSESRWSDTNAYASKKVI
ncbi:myosin-1-like [Trifolium medium]|uniref:Myosin-1-like n=1 Tax=Trifolium medium TaxID=97028 RepID=A0A392MGL8_9FABA|nr:myosin-1-like [Trifolium medium]